MKDIVIMTNTAIGSVLALAEGISKNIKCNIYVLCTDLEVSKILNSSNYIIDSTYINIANGYDFFNEVKKWLSDKDIADKAIIYCTTDTICFYINQYRDWYEENFILSLPSMSIINDFTEKGQAEIIAFENGLIVPKSRVIFDENDIEYINRNFNFPIILKPKATYVEDALGLKIKVLYNKNELNFFYSYYTGNKGSILCQEFIPGGDDTSYYYLFYRAKSGKIYENMGRKTMQSTPEGGIMLKGLSEYNEELSIISKNFLNKINYKGMGGLEFKKYNNKYYFIEMNVRIEGILKISETSGTKLSFISFLDLCDQEVNEIGKQQDGVLYVDLIPTLLNYYKNRNYLLAVFEIISIVFKPKVYLNIMNLRDIKPFFNYVLNLFKNRA